jgi:hypothetical protein
LIQSLDQDRDKTKGIKNNGEKKKKNKQRIIVTIFQTPLTPPLFLFLESKRALLCFFLIKEALRSLFSRTDNN